MVRAALSMTRSRSSLVIAQVLHEVGPEEGRCNHSEELCGHHVGVVEFGDPGCVGIAQVVPQRCEHWQGCEVEGAFPRLGEWGDSAMTVRIGAVISGLASSST